MTSFSNSKDPLKPLLGIRVLDLSSVVAGPLGTQFLSELGADVIKVEAVGAGPDQARYLGPIHPCGLSALYITVNRGKRCIAMNLKTEKGYKIFEKLVAKTDVLLHNYRPGVAQRMKIDYETMKKIRPSLIYFSVTGYGDTGPLSKSPVYDYVIQGLSGFMDIQGNGERPATVRNFIVDKITALYVSQSLLAALFARERTGKGCYVQLAMLDAVINFLWSDGMWNHTFQDPAYPKDQPPVSEINPAVQTNDGFVVTVPVSDAQWALFCKAFNREDLIQNPDYKTLPLRLTAKKRGLQGLFEVIEGETSKYSTEEVLRRLDQFGVPGGPINRVGDVPTFSQVVHNKLIFDVVHPIAGPLMQASFPTFFDGVRPTIKNNAPSFGQHSRSVLYDELDLSKSEVEALVQEGVIFTPTTAVSQSKL